MSVVINRFHNSSYSSGGVPAFTYTGTDETTVDGKKWEIVLKDSGTFNLSKSVKCDIFLQAGGNSGNWSSDAQWYGAAGGSGGNYLTMTEITLAAGNYTVTVGGSDSASVFGTYTTANGSSGSAGGQRAMGDFDGYYTYSIIQSSTAGSAGRLAFTGANITDCITPSLHGFKFGAGGGGGGISVGYATDSGSSGGTNGGGSGGTSNKNGAVNSGSGGGGAYGGSYSPGSGGSGIIIIRGGF